MQVLSEVIAANGNFGDCVWNSIAFVNWNSMRNAFSRINHCACGASSGEQTENGSIAEIESWYFEFGEPTRLIELEARS